MSAEHGLSKEYVNQLLESVSIDHDGTIANSRAAVTYEFNSRYRTNHSVDDLNHWDAVKDWCHTLKMTNEQADKVNYELWYTPDTLLKSELNAGVQEFIDELIKRKSKFIINSSRKPNLHKSTIEWYKRKLPIVSSDRIHTGLPDIEDGTVSKVLRILASGNTLHIEDIPEHAKLILDHTNVHVVLLSNSSQLTCYKSDRLIQIKRTDGRLPDFTDLNRLLFS